MQLHLVLRYKFIGMRAGEKLHEEMITATDSYNCVEFDNYYVILPSMPLWDIDRFIRESSTQKGKKCRGGFTYSSNSNSDFLTSNEIKFTEKREFLK